MVVSLSLSFSLPGYLSFYVVYVLVVVISSFIYQRQKRLRLSSLEGSSGPGYSPQNTQTAEKMKKQIYQHKHHLHLQSLTLRTPRKTTFSACLMGPVGKNMVGCQNGGWGVLFLMKCICMCCRGRVQAAPALHRVHQSDPADLSEPSGPQEVEDETVELESLQSGEGVSARRQQRCPSPELNRFVAGRCPWRSCCGFASL